MSVGKRYGIILPGSVSFPGGNDAEFPLIREQLHRCGVGWCEREVQKSSTVFWFYAEEICKLPTDSNVIDKDPHYVPVDSESGHAISLLDNFLDTHQGEDTTFS